MLRPKTPPGSRTGRLGNVLGRTERRTRRPPFQKKNWSGEPNRSREGPRESHESERTDTASETEQEVSGGSARGESHESEQTDMASETEQEVRRYLKDIEYPASKDDLVSAARSNDAPQELIQKLVDLSIKEYSDPEEVAVAVDSLGGGRGG